MKITFLGAAETVTGSKYLVESGDAKVLVDCGLFQGPKELRQQNWQQLPVDASEIDAVVLTHAHIDHTGYVPLLVKRGFKGKIYCTSATLDLCRVMLPDAGKIQEEDAAYANRKGYSKHKPALPLYTADDAEESLKQFHATKFDQDTELSGDLVCHFTYGGHILGASIVTIFDGKQSIVFSGDLGRPNDLLMWPPRWIKRADYVVIESTYGGREHGPADLLDQLEASINRVIKRGGVVIVPAFSVGRTQTILYGLYQLRRANRLPKVPIYLNSPMSINATEIFENHPAEHRLDKEQCKEMCNVAQYVNTVEESKALNQKKGPMVIISASGMLEGGRVLHHLKIFGPDPKNMILLTGYQAEGTRGRDLLSGKKTIKIHGEQVEINAELAEIDNLSAHADQSEMLDWLSHFGEAPKMAFITHGELKSAESLKEAIHKRLGWACRIPKYLESISLK